MITLLIRMEVGNVPASLPSLTKINKELNALIEANVKLQLRQVLADIADKHRLSKNDLFRDYITDITVEKLDTSNNTVKKRIRRNVPSHERCTALTSNMEQCSRKRKGTNLFCGSHLNSRNYGVIDQE